IVEYLGNDTTFVDTTYGDRPAKVKLLLTNYGSDELTSMDVEYQVGSNAPVSETWSGSLQSGDTVAYIFNQTFTSAYGTYNMCGRTQLTGDADASNDEVCDGWRGIVGIESHELPGFILYQNRPNPAMELTEIDFEVPYGGIASFMVVDLFGRELESRELIVTAGYHSLSLDVSHWSPGVYYYSITFDGYRLVRKMVINK
ncbi:MAG: T9SS type A sorting domain-containing protein, partial [Bacteroidota bacterium]